MEKKIPEAQEYFKKALAICSFNVDALFDLGYTYEASKQWDLAIQTYKQVLHYQKDSPDVYYRLGTTYQMKGDCVNAGKYYSVISQQNPLLSKEIDKLITECR